MSAPVVLALTAGFVAEAANGRLMSGDPSRVFATVSTDSRALPAGEAKHDTLFIALHGPTFNGHAFVPELVRAGIAGVLIGTELDLQTLDVGRRTRDGADGADAAAVIVVSDTLDALQRLARAVRRASGARVIAITGSAGKTTTKEMTAELLGARFNVFRNAGNLNNHIGLPLSLLELRRGAEIAVVELGMNHAGEIHELVAIAEPDVRLWTNVGDAHIGHFGSREAIADAKAEILGQASAATVLVANADDPLIASRIGRFPGRTITFGTSAGASVRATEIVDRGFDGTSATVTLDVARPDVGRPDVERSVSITVPLPGLANLMNALAAIAVAADHGIGAAEITARLAGVRPVARRGEVVALANGARLIDDSYNASPAAMKLALAALKATPAKRRVAVLGEMRELGALSRQLHAECGVAAAQAGVDLLIAIGGPDADGLAAGSANAVRFADSAAAADAIDGLIREGDLILVKGSRGTRTDIVADRLKGRA
ncbi:MAG: UDP-N-acetylmuramoyl-tripeptide--D-alanyl-D-alanine ligase [Acidobacteria bacterium]|nr:MAG: UDP-N-acetylmuramoyl-tripeptide--D-alanyl-D-alanine ligase [Acidobacteriota bacterium]